MPKLVDALKLSGNPFEHYVAETEPNIAEYAVKPPYFTAIDARARNTTSFVLFGDRGSGKSATRLTVFQELWTRRARGEEAPIAVSMIDFSSVVKGRSFQNLSEATLVKDVVFLVLESLLAWLSTLSEEDQTINVGALTNDEVKLCYEMLRDHYLSRPEAKRERSAREAMHLMHQKPFAKNRLWVEQRWESVSKLLGALTDAVTKRYVDMTGAGANVAGVLAKTANDDFDSVLLLRRTVDLVKVFGFSGVAILVDKVDETQVTTNSYEKTAELIHPLLAHVQLLEVKGFSWIFFLWHRIKGVFEAAEFPVRLDKIGHATVSWDDEFLLLMLDKRVQFFSGGKSKFSSLFESDVDIGAAKGDLLRVSMRSPRELIRLMDVIVREHDIAHAEEEAVTKIGAESIEQGLDKYVTDVVSTVYGERLLAQIFRLNRLTFTNKDVQQTFRMGSQSARTRIQTWENAGILKLTGTKAAEGAGGGKPANEYTIVDTRVERIMRRQLVAYSDPIVAEPEFLAEESAS